MITLNTVKDIVVFILFIVNFYVKHIIRVPPPSNNSQVDDCCSICLEEIREDSVKTFECDHYFHLECLNQWVSKSATCPVCRTKLSVIHKIKINNETTTTLIHN